MFYVGIVGEVLHCTVGVLFSLLHGHSLWHILIKALNTLESPKTIYYCVSYSKSLSIIT